jgi:hypothetical protein
LSQEIQIHQVLHEESSVDDYQDLGAQLTLDDSTYLPLSRELGQKLITASNDFMRVKATAAI